ncbi:MAG: hypothetical protein IKS04_04945 [Clostridia bacterium]|nr:hypothetical protein [Clostridia bacterium]
MSEYMDRQMPDLIAALKALGVDKQTTVGICCMLETDAEMNRIIDLLYERKDNITAEEAEQICLRVIAGKE